MTTVLVAKGAQDKYLNGENPTVTFFKARYQKHTNFSQSVLSQVISGSPTKDGISEVTFERKGDLVGYTYFTKKTTSGEILADITSEDIRSVEIIIGDQVIDEITTDQLVSSRFFNSKYSKSDIPAYEKNGVLGFYGAHMYPLGFWFCQASTMAFPIVGLQYHDMRLRINWGNNPTENAYFEMWTNYYYLDTVERKKMENLSEEILICQHQETPLSTGLALNLNFNNPVRYLYCKAGVSDLFGKSIPNTTDTVKVMANGVELTTEKELHPHYTNVPMYYHTNYGVFANKLYDVNVTKQGGIVTDVTAQKENGSIPSFLYPFCINCAEYTQPNGSCNFSRLDSFELRTSSVIKKPIYGVSYNILKIDKGMGGLLFSS